MYGALLKVDVRLDFSFKLLSVASSVTFAVTFAVTPLCRCHVELLPVQRVVLLVLTLQEKWSHISLFFTLEST